RRKKQEFRVARSRQTSSAIPCLDTREFSLVTCQNVEKKKEYGRWCPETPRARGSVRLLARCIRLGSHIPLGIEFLRDGAVDSQGMTAFELERPFGADAALLILAALLRHGLYGHGGQHIAQLGHVRAAGGTRVAILHRLTEIAQQVHAHQI